MFQPNRELLIQYQASHAYNRETYVDFGKVPTDILDRQDWNAEVTRFLSILARREYYVRPTIHDGNSGFCSFYILTQLSLQKVDLPSLQQVIDQCCYQGQTTIIHEHVLEIHALGDGQSLGEILASQ